jgi:hypothetical protein
MNSNSSAVKPDGVFSMRRLGLAGLAGIAACAGCCSVPLLVATGVGGGALTGLAAYVRPGAELVVGLGAAGLVLGMAALRNRRRTSVFRSPAPGPDEPIVCTADLAGKPTVQGQMDGYRVAFAHLLRTERFSGGFRWVFRKEPGLEAHLKQLAENEHQCCRFFSFDVATTSEQIYWETRAHHAAASVLELFSQLPERLKLSRYDPFAIIERRVVRGESRERPPSGVS